MAGVLMAAGDGHPADVNDVAVWFDANPAQILGGQRTWRQDEPAGRDRRTVVPGDDVHGVLVVPVSFAAIGDVRLERPALFDHGEIPETVSEVALMLGARLREAIPRSLDDVRREGVEGDGPGAHAGIVGGG